MPLQWTDTTPRLVQGHTVLHVQSAATCTRHHVHDRGTVVAKERAIRDVDISRHLGDVNAMVKHTAHGRYCHHTRQPRTTALQSKHFLFCLYLRRSFSTTFTLSLMVQSRVGTKQARQHTTSRSCGGWRYTAVTGADAMHSAPSHRVHRTQMSTTSHPRTCGGNRSPQLNQGPRNSENTPTDESRSCRFRKVGDDRMTAGGAKHVLQPECLRRTLAALVVLGA